MFTRVSDFCGAMSVHSVNVLSMLVDKKYMRVWELSTATCYAEHLVYMYYPRLEPAPS